MAKKAELDYKEVWKMTLAQLEVKLDNPIHFRTWVLPTTLMELKSNKATVAVRDYYAAEWLKRKHQIDIEDTLTYVVTGKRNFSPRYKVTYTINSELVKTNPLKPVPPKKLPGNIPNSLLDMSGGESNQLQDAMVQNNLNPKLSFENYVVGDSNKMAHAAALAVAAKPGITYNPLFIYGDTGLGKTHLAHAIGRRMLEKNIEKKIVYISAEGFMNEMVKAIKTGKNIQFRQKYRESADLLVIDDIQYISNWEKTQTEFFNTFNVLQAANKQIIIISDRPPEELENLTPRLKSRFQGGIVVEINKPDYEHRIAILQKKLISMHKTVKDEVVEFIAKSIADNIRELEGALQKIILYAELTPGYEMTLESVAKQLGRDTISKRKKVNVAHVVKIVAREFDIKASDIKGRRRTAEIALARQICMYILREELNYKLEEIAKALERQDHTTVMHGIDKIKSKRMVDETFRGQLISIVDKLFGQE